MQDARGGAPDVESFVIEERFLAKVRDSCHEDKAPAELRTRIVTRLRMEHDASR